MLVLERKATHLAEEQRTQIVAQPFGGGVRLNSPKALLEISGKFHYDTESSRRHQDFRVMVPPSSWEAVRDFCLEHFGKQNEAAVEFSPQRELAEEFKSALGIELEPAQVDLRPLWVVIENSPVASGNVHAAGVSTVRVYQVFQAGIVDTALQGAILENSRGFSDQHLQDSALQDALEGRRGWANAFLALPLEDLRDFYLTLPPEQRDAPAKFQGRILESNIPALFDTFPVPKYRRVRNDSGAELAV